MIVYWLQVYYDMYEQEKERYDQEMRQYQEREGGRVSESRQSDADSAAAMGIEAQSAVDALIMDN